MQFTESEAAKLQQAYDALNKALFDNELAPCLMLFHRHKGALGYFRPKAFDERGKDDPVKGVHEIALNPDTFRGRTDLEILSTLAHEMVHLWQQDHGRPPRRCYHDRQWADKMEEVGLMPSDTGAEGGRRTGQKMTHYILPGGEFELAAAELLKSGFSFGFEGNPAPKNAKKKTGKVKYTCPDCGARAWAKPESQLKCGACDIEMEQE